jgi:molecular chaperone DnaK (HSP70)
MTNAIAIDFGTSRTKAAYWDERTGKPQLMHLGYRNELFLPSLFYLPSGNDNILWGDQAEVKIEDDPAGIVDVPKRRLQERYIYQAVDFISFASRIDPLRQKRERLVSYYF